MRCAQHSEKISFRECVGAEWRKQTACETQYIKTYKKIYLEPTREYLKVYFVKFLFWWIGFSLVLECRGHGINKQYKLGSIGLDECDSKLMGLKTLKSCGEILISQPKL